jgi:membrane-bound ClpP family serine protease
VDGERWRVRADQPLRADQRVRITRVDGLTLEVSPDTSQGAFEMIAVPIGLSAS